MHADRPLWVRADYEARIADLEAANAKLLADLAALKHAHAELQQAMREMTRKD